MNIIPQLYGKIRYNGKLLNEWEVVSVGNSDNDRKFGISTSIEREDSIGVVPLFIKRNKDLPPIDIQLFKCDYMGNGLKITEDDLFELNRILFAKDDIGVLENNGKVYYGHFVGDSSIWMNSAKQGYITLSYELASPYCYSPIMLNPVRISESKRLEIFNKSNASEKMYCDIEFELLDDSSFINITNLTTGEMLEINNLELKEKATILGDSREIISKVDDTRNLFKLSNRNFKSLELVYGKNIYEINSKSAKVKIVYQNELGLM